MVSPGSHYFDEEPTSESDPREVLLMLPDAQFTLRTDRGVFGYDRIDQGTKSLLLDAPAPAETGNLLDLGCGTGAIALTMAHRSPGATVWAVDVNERARDLCRSNAERNGLANVRVAAPDEVPEDVRFATIWSNPAIRIGKPALHAMLLRWLARLDADGAAVMVVHKHLGSDSLQRWLTEQGYPTERLGSSSGFRLLRSRRAT
ncbi:MAG: methyltransferase [Acidobacteria bacterium]|nr:methyltransferase [Acidobacteriota bacterium]